MTQTEQDESSNAADAVNKRKKQEASERFFELAKANAIAQTNTFYDKDEARKNAIARIEKRNIAQAKRNIPKCATCKYFYVSWTCSLAGMSGCSKFKRLINNSNFHCAFHEPKQETI